MNLKLLLVLSVLFLTACATHTARDDSPASDLDALVTTVSNELQPRLLPNGKTYCAELAKTEEAQDECTGNLEDTYFGSEQDKARGITTLKSGVKRIKLSRSPCKWYQFKCKREAPK